MFGESFSKLVSVGLCRQNLTRVRRNVAGCSPDCGQICSESVDHKANVLEADPSPSSTKVVRTRAKSVKAANNLVESGQYWPKSSHVLSMSRQIWPNSGKCESVGRIRTNRAKLRRNPVQGLAEAGPYFGRPTLGHHPTYARFLATGSRPHLAPSQQSRSGSSNSNFHRRSVGLTPQRRSIEASSEEVSRNRWQSDDIDPKSTMSAPHRSASLHHSPLWPDILAKSPQN